MTTTNQSAGLFLIGMALGTFIHLPAPLNVINPYLWIVFVVIGLILLLRK